MEAMEGGHQLSDLPPELLSMVFGLLSPQTLARCSCVSTAWRQLATQCQWEGFYAALWSLTPGEPASGGAAWQRRYGARQAATHAWLGRPALDKLAGHSSAVKTCELLPQQGLLFTGGVDRCVRAWDLHSGTQLAFSRRHAGTVRCLAADTALLASGSSDHRIRIWLPSDSAGGSSGSSSSTRMPFDLAGERAVLGGHAGPVSSLQLTPEVLVSGSWDCTIRVWDRSSLECTQLVHTDDWVSGLSLRGGLLAAACGREVLLYSLEACSLHRLCSLACPNLGSGSSSGGATTGSSGSGPAAAEAAAVTAVECSADGCTLFIGAADGAVWVADLSSLRSGGKSGSIGGSGSSGAPQPTVRPVLLQQQAAEVAGLSWDHPWLAVADRSGSVVLIDAGSATAAGSAATEGNAAAGSGGGTAGSSSKKWQQKQQARTVRVLHACGMGGGGASAAAQCVGLAGCWAAAGLDCGTVVTWDGSKGLQQQAAAAAARQAKAERRQRNLDRQAQQRRRRRHSQSSSAGSGGSAQRSSGRSHFLAAPEEQAAEAGGARPTSAVDGRVAAASMNGPAGPQQAAALGLPGPLPAPQQALGRSPSSTRMRVPPPLRPEALAAAATAAAVAGASGSCRQQAWQVLRPARAAPAAESTAGGRGAGTPL